MAYDHRKSNRVLTDRQFSRGTAIGGTRIDDALGESIDRFNHVRKGDLSSRFVRNVFSFGYTPSPVTANPVQMRAPAAPAFDIVAPVMSAGRAESMPVPWLPLPNNRHTTVKTTVSATPYPDRYRNTDGAIPPSGFQNDWKVKGTEIDEYPDGRPGIGNAGSYPSEDWLGVWSDRANTATGNDVDVAIGYQLAWTQSWQFERPVILDDLAVVIQLSDLFDISLGYDDTSGNTLPSRGLGVVVHVDNDVAKEDRSANDVEAIFSNRPILLSFVAMGTDRASVTYGDMFPNSPEFAGGSGDGLKGRVVRFRDMNIPIRQFARVRLSIIVPQYPVAGDANNQKGWNRSLGTHIFMQPTNDDDTTNGFVPDGVMAPLNFVISGSMTVLEEVQG